MRGCAPSANAARTVISSLGVGGYFCRASCIARCGCRGSSLHLPPLRATTRSRGRKPPPETSECRAGGIERRGFFAAPRFRQTRFLLAFPDILLAQDSKYLFAVVAPVFVQVGKKGMARIPKPGRVADLRHDRRGTRRAWPGSHRDRSH
jgi:hypothetical protein